MYAGASLRAGAPPASGLTGGPPKLVAVCEVCGNEYDKAFEVLTDGTRHVFDSFECAIHALAPPCVHCGCRIVGHGLEQKGEMFCCANCARLSGVDELRDRSSGPEIEVAEAVSP